MLDRIVIRYERQITREIASTMRACARNIEDGSGAYISQLFAPHKARVNRILTELWTVAATDMQQHLTGVAKAAMVPLVIKRAEIRATVGADKIVRDYISIYGGDKITAVAKTTIDQIADAISEGIREGLSEREIAKSIRAVAPTKSASRAQTIARTESHQAANYSAQATVEALGLNLKKEWVPAFESERSRPEHQEMAGTVVELNESFTVDGEELRYPGDPAGSAGNVINCRCAVVYVA